MNRFPPNLGCGCFSSCFTDTWYLKWWNAIFFLWRHHFGTLYTYECWSFTSWWLKYWYKSILVSETCKFCEEISYFELPYNKKCQKQEKKRRIRPFRMRLALVISNNPYCCCCCLFFVCLFVCFFRLRYFHTVQKLLFYVFFYVFIFFCFVFVFVLFFSLGFDWITITV